MATVIQRPHANEQQQMDAVLIQSSGSPTESLASGSEPAPEAWSRGGAGRGSRSSGEPVARRSFGRPQQTANPALRISHPSFVFPTTREERR